MSQNEGNQVMENGDILKGREKRKEGLWDAICLLLPAVVFLAYFCPIFWNVIWKGRLENYNDIEKITTIIGNKRLIAVDAAIFLVILGLYLLLRRLPKHRYSFAGVAIFAAMLSVGMYGVNIWIAKNIAFYGGWDCGAVANSVRWLAEGQDIGNGIYYKIYTNNVPIIWILYKLYHFAQSLSNYPYNPEFSWIQFQSMLFSLAAFCVALIVLLIDRKPLKCLFASIAAVFFLGLTPWETVGYTDSCSIAFPVLILLFYVIYFQSKKPVRYVIWFLIVLAGGVGGLVKATVSVALIAVVLMEVLWKLFLDQENWKKRFLELTVCILILLAGMGIRGLVKAGMYAGVGFVEDPNYEMTWSNYLYIGMDGSTTGAASSDGLDLVEESYPMPIRERQKLELSLAWERIREKGFRGNLDFFLRKMTMNYNDGTFSWYQEGYFNAWEYQKLSDSKYQEKLRDFYWDERKDYAYFTTISQGAWLFMLAGVTLEALYVVLSVWMQKKLQKNRREMQHPESMQTEVSLAESRKKLHLRNTALIMLLGISFFVMLFEGRARYLLNFIPVYAAAGMLGYLDLSDVVAGLLEKRRGRSGRAGVNPAPGSKSNEN